MRVVLHGGFHKTATSYMQSLLQRIRGYEVLNCDAVSTRANAWPVNIPDPKQSGHRARISIPGRYYLGFAVRKISQKSTGSIQQSDYVQRWKNSETA